MPTILESKGKEIGGGGGHFFKGGTYLILWHLFGGMFIRAWVCIQ